MWTLKSELHMLIEYLLFNLINVVEEKQSSAGLPRVWYVYILTYYLLCAIFLVCYPVFSIQWSLKLVFCDEVFFI